MAGVSRLRLPPLERPEMKMKITRVGLSLCFAFYSFVLFFTTTGIQEIAHDQRDGKPLPALAELSQIFDPIGYCLVIFPLLVGFASWRALDPVKPSFPLILTHVLFVGFAAAVFFSVLLAVGFFTYLNGVHPVTGRQVGGNIIIGAGLLFVIVRSYVYPTRTEPDGDGKPDPVSI
jgi:hypothetical protein